MRMRTQYHDHFHATKPALAVATGMIMEWRTVKIFLCLLAASVNGIFPLFPRPALYDMQLSAGIRVSVEFSGVFQDVCTTFTFHPHSQCVEGVSYNYTVMLWQGGASRPSLVEGPFPASSCEETLDVTVRGLHRSQHYTASIVAYNDRISLRSKRVDVYTSAVQAVDVVQGEECLFVTCYFAPGSSAQGCQVQMRVVATHSSRHLHSWTFNITRDPVDYLMGTLRLPLEPRTTTVDVAVYDLTASGRVGYLSIPTHVSYSNSLNCNLGETLTPLRAKAKMVLFYMSACFFILGLLIICGGMMCKVGRLHRHFRIKSYEILEGREPEGQRCHHHCGSSTRINESEDELPSKTRHFTHPQPKSVLTAKYGSKRRARTYGSYDDTAGSPVGRILLNIEEGEKRWGGLREATAGDAILVSLDVPHEEILENRQTQEEDGNSPTSIN